MTSLSKHLNGLDPQNGTWNVHNVACQRDGISSKPISAWLQALGNSLVEKDKKITGVKNVQISLQFIINWDVYLNTPPGRTLHPNILRNCN